MFLEAGNPRRQVYGRSQWRQHERHHRPDRHGLLGHNWSHVPGGPAARTRGGKPGGHLLRAVRTNGIDVSGLNKITAIHFQLMSSFLGSTSLRARALKRVIWY